MTILTASTRLSDVLTFALSFLTDRFAVSDLRRTDLGLYLEFTAQTVDDDIQVQLTDTSDDRLSGLLVCICLERRVFFSQLSQRQTHLVLVSLCLRLQRQLDHRFREFHGFQNDRVCLITQRITCRRGF